MKANPAFKDSDVEGKFASFPEPQRTRLLRLRHLIFETAQETPGVGALQETLKWGQAAYLTPETKSGSTIRIDVTKQGGLAIYTHCQSTLISDFQSLFPSDFAYEGKRAIHFAEGKKLPLAKLRMFVRSALTYHLKRPK